MTTLPSATALAVLVVLSGIAGVVAADPTGASTAAVTPTAVETTPTTDAASEPTTVPPDRDASFEQRLAGRLSQFDLTDEQVRTVVAEAVRLREAGASRLVVRSAVVMHLYGYGVDAPFLYAGGDDGQSAADRIAARLGERFDLTDAQVDDIAATIERMRADGASRAEIYRAVRALLVEYGVDEDELRTLDRRAKHARAHQLHERAHRLHHAATGGADRAPGATDAERDAVDRRIDALQHRHDLTDEQAAALERLVRDRLADGASREEVRAAVRDRLAGWGVEEPTTRRTPADESADGAADR